jgi:hypothetical protein
MLSVEICLSQFHPFCAQNGKGHACVKHEVWHPENMQECLAVLLKFGKSCPMANAPGDGKALGIQRGQMGLCIPDPGQKPGQVWRRICQLRNHLSGKKTSDAQGKLRRRGNLLAGSEHVRRKPGLQHLFSALDLCKKPAQPLQVMQEDRNRGRVAGARRSGRP